VGHRSYWCLLQQPAVALIRIDTLRAVVSALGCFFACLRVTYQQSLVPGCLGRFVDLLSVISPAASAGKLSWFLLQILSS
jgi:hypothetical protein